MQKKIIQFLLAAIFTLISCHRGNGISHNPAAQLVHPSPSPTSQHVSSNPNPSISPTAEFNEAQWVNHTTGLHWGAVIIQGSPFLAERRRSGYPLPETGWLFYEAQNYCESHQARLPTLDEWRELLAAIGAQSDAEATVNPSSFEAPQFLARASIDGSEAQNLLNWIWLNTEADDEDHLPSMTVYHYIANRQTGAIDIAGHRSAIPFVCVW